MHEIKTYAKATLVAFAIGISVATFLGFAVANTYTVVKIIGAIFV